MEDKTNKRYPVTMVLSRCDQTGMTINTFDLVKALKRYQDKIDIKLIIGHNPGEDDISDGLFERFKALGLPITTYYPAKVLSRKSIFYKLKSSISFIRALRKAKGVIHMQSPYMTWAPWLLGKKFISTFHTTALQPCFYYKNATHLIAISKETKEYAISVFGYNEKDITIVHHGVDSKFAKRISEEEKIQIKDRLGLPKDKIIITLVGTIEPRKGQDILIKAVMLLPPEIRRRIHILLLGSDNHPEQTNQKWLDKIIEEEGAREIISIFPYQDPLDFYHISDIFVLPSWKEGFPLVTIEALLSGCLTIRSDAEGAHEQIIDGATGYIFPKGDFERLSQIIEMLVRNPKLLAEIRKVGQEYAMQHFISDEMAKNTLRVYDDFIQNFNIEHK
ncbi:MAG: glycosyltransferase family 4 protein [Bacteroides sp.]|nr:glycosyltransferase family 4 protein [Bacteroides sp.]